MIELNSLKSKYEAKCSELDSIQTSNIETNKKLNAILDKLDCVIKENESLKKRISFLEKASEPAPSQPPVPSPPPPPPSNSNKKQYDLLVLSDSIFRHVGGDCPKSNSQKGALITEVEIYHSRNDKSSFLRAVVTGARSTRLYAEALLLLNEYKFKEIIVHVGTN